MAGGITTLATGRPMCVERMTGPAALVTEGPPGTSGLDICENYVQVGS